MAIQYVSLAKGRAKSAETPEVPVVEPTPEPTPETSVIKAAKTQHGGKSASINEEG